MTAPDITNVPEGPAWPEPLPLVKKPQTVAFPTEVFPKVVRDFIQETAESLDVPVDLVGVPALGALAVATQGRVNVEYSTDWREPVVLYLLTVAPPGAKKSPALKHATAPLYVLENEIQRDMKAEISARTYKRELLEEQLKALKKQAQKGDTEAQAEYEQAGLEFDLFEVPRPPVLIADDATPDVLLDLAGGNRGAIALVSAEGDIFGTFAGKYSGQPDTQALTKGHSGDPVKVHRLGREGVTLPEFRLNVLLMLQPAVLERTKNQFGVATQGLLERFLFSLPETWVSERLDTKPVSEQTREAYSQLLQKIGRTCWEVPEYINLQLEDEAREGIGRFFSDIARGRKPGGLFDQSPLLQGWSAKLTGQTLRLAGLLHMAGNPQNPLTPITKNEIEVAGKLARYFVHEVIKAEKTMAGNGDMEGAENLLKIIQGKRFETFTATDIVRNSGYKHIRDLAEPLATLAETHHIARVESQGKGRPAQRFVVSPHIIRQYKHQKSSD